MSYKKLNYEELTIEQLLIELDDLIYVHDYTSPDDFGEDEFFESEARKMITVIRKKYTIQKNTGLSNTGAYICDNCHNVHPRGQQPCK